MFTDEEIVERSTRPPESFWDEISKNPEYFFADINQQSSHHFISSILQGATVKARCSLFFEKPSGLTNGWTESKFKTKEKLYRDLVLGCFLASDTDFAALVNEVITNDDSTERLVNLVASLCFTDTEESREILATTIDEVKHLAESGTSPTEIIATLRQQQFLKIVGEIKSNELEIYHTKIRKEALAIRQMSQQDRQKMQDKKQRQAQEAEYRKKYPKRNPSDPGWLKVVYVLIPALFLTYCGIKTQENIKPWNHPACEALGMESNVRGTECYFKD